MPDIFIQIVAWLSPLGLLGYLLVPMFVYAFVRGWLYLKLWTGDSEKHKPVFDKAKQLVRSEHWGTRYRLFLQKVLSKLTGVIGDGYRFPHELPDKPRLRADNPAIADLHRPDNLKRVFGVNPFTPESYQFCILLALLYPILSFILGWVVGGAGTLGGFELLSDDILFWRRLSVILILLSWP